MEKFKAVIECPQTCDMGDGHGRYDFAPGATLIDFLKWFKENERAWGTITILRRNKIIRCFDYDLWNANQFYLNLSGWLYDEEIRRLSFHYCFMK